MPRFDNIPPKPRAEPVDVSFANGWLMDIVSIQSGTEQIIYRDCSLMTLAKASALFERIAFHECNKPRGYGFETKLRYVLPKGIAAAAFLRILEWLYAINEITAHGEIEDPQISTFDSDGLMHYLRLLQAATLLELKYPFGNQKRLPDMIKANIKKAFDTKDSRFKTITIHESEIGVIWDMAQGDRNEPVVKLTLALIVEAMDLRKENPGRYKDNILQRFEALMSKNAAFKSAVVDVKTKKEVRKREEERERRGEPKIIRGRPQQRFTASITHKKGNAKKSAVWFEDWETQELTETQVQALMSRPEEFQVAVKRGSIYERSGGGEEELEGYGPA